MNKQRTKKAFNFTIYKAVIIGLVLFLLTSLIMGCKSAKDTTAIAAGTAEMLKQQCISFGKLAETDRTKSLFRLTDLICELSSRLEYEPDLVNGGRLEEFAENLHIDGIMLFDGELNIQASFNTLDPSLRETVISGRFSDILDYPEKILAERTEINGEYYDICAAARKDAEGIIIGYYKQTSGLISSAGNDLESLLAGLDPERDGQYAIIENGELKSTSSSALKKEGNYSSLIKQLSHIEQDGRLHLIKADKKHCWGFRSVCDNYTICIYYPFSAVFAGTLSASAAFAAAYFFFCVLYFAVRSRILYENQEKLRESNRLLTENVQMLRSLETIYFSLFYVDLSTDSYDTICIAPWLKEAVPMNGAYTTLKSTLLNTMVVPAYREDVDRRMSDGFIRESLCKENITDIRKSFYTDYQSMRNGKLKWCRASVTVVDFDEIGMPVHVLALLQDVSKEKTREADYQAQILKESHDAKAANLAKTEFLRCIGHDIQAPVNEIKSCIDTASERPNDIELQTQCRERATAVLVKLLDVMNSIADMSRLEDSEIVPEEKPFDLAKLLNEIGAVIKPQTESKNIRFELMRSGNLPISHLIGSAPHVSQILLNLAGNAVRYGKSGGYFRLDARLVSSNDREAVYEFICEDNGIGMSEEFQKYMFEPFAQESKDTRTAHEGIGLGLPIAKKLVDVLGGTISCHSEKNVGTTFIVRLPFRIDTSYALPVSKPHKAGISPLQGKNVLLAEDNELNLEIAEFLLTERGANVTKARNGQGAVNIFSASEVGAFDIIFMDMIMPVKDGLTAAREIRALDRADAKTVPIAAMSVDTFANDIRLSLDAGMNAHISKPIDEKKLTETAEKLLKEHSKAAET